MPPKRVLGGGGIPFTVYRRADKFCRVHDRDEAGMGVNAKKPPFGGVTKAI